MMKRPLKKIAVVGRGYRRISRLGLEQNNRGNKAGNEGKKVRI